MKGTMLVIGLLSGINYDNMVTEKLISENEEEKTVAVVKGLKSPQVIHLKGEEERLQQIINGEKELDLAKKKAQQEQKRKENEIQQLIAVTNNPS